MFIPWLVPFMFRTPSYLTPLPEPVRFKVPTPEPFGPMTVERARMELEVARQTAEFSRKACEFQARLARRAARR